MRGQFQLSDQRFRLFSKDLEEINNLLVYIIVGLDWDLRSVQQHNRGPAKDVNKVLARHIQLWQKPGQDGELAAEIRERVYLGGDVHELF